ncbi:angiopoietin-related protein 1-like [Stylophora pistillata]|uniref:angiopoietin-related protein 1-like n=1 Tax=Stylophora pistillata TaxID=50429 RepID=UPI000C04EF8D|nr:angiopoietin-related protein 1-like [Stylophora pistillata]
MTIRIDMEDYDGDRAFAEYTTFSGADEGDNYRVTIDGYRGDVGDSLVLHSKSIRNMSFTTRDRDNDIAKGGNCGLRYKGGWWYSNCHAANPNGLYQEIRDSVVYGIGRISEPDLRAVNFADKIEGQKLNGNLVREVEVDSETSCQLSIARLSEPDLRAVNFADKVEGQKLNGSLIREVEVDFETSCQLECVDEERCQTYNFGTVKAAPKIPLAKKTQYVSQAANQTFTSVSVSENCLDYYQNSFTTDGVYWIYPDEKEPFKVLCDMTNDGGGWTTLQRRMDGSVDFYVDWESYKKGFGNLKGEFWLGNDYIHRLTESVNMMVRTDMEDYEGDRRFAEYTTFSVADESDDYRMTIDGDQGTPVDALLYLSRPIRNMRLTTKDRDNDFLDNGNCAMAFRGGWWYNY